MTDWKSLSSFIGTVLTGGILVSTFNFFYNDFLNQPNILITIDDDPKIPKVGAVVEIENIGLEPAANLYMQIKAPNEINVTNIESGEKFSIIENETDPNMERVYSPRFVHGEGSLSRIYLETPISHIEEANYTIYSTFDQGSSSVIHKPKPPADEWDLIHSLPLLMYDHVPEWYKFYLTGGFRNALFWLFTFGIVFVLFGYFANHFVARRRYMSFVHEINSQISAVYKKLEYNKANRAFLESFKRKSDRLIRCKRSDLENRKYPRDTSEVEECLRQRSFRKRTKPLVYTVISALFPQHHAKWRSQHRWRSNIWDLWYIKSDEFKSRAIHDDEEYNAIEDFFRCLTDRELLVELKNVKKDVKRSHTKQRSSTRKLMREGL
jgi:hypothetical protein